MLSMRIVIVSILFVCWMKTGVAQYFQFSQYNFTPQRINPAQVASSDYAKLSFDYRNQATDGGFHLTSNMLNVSYPFISRTGKRWSGVGLSFMDDRSGQAGLFNTQEAGLSYALNVFLAKYQTLSLGVKALYQSRKIDLGGLYTGAQYIPDRGFSEALSSGENAGQYSTSFMTFSTGLYWQQTDKEGTSLAYWGISFFDFNKPENSFLVSQSRLNSTLVASAGFRAYYRGNISLFPEALYTRSAANNVLNIGCVTRYDVKPYSSEGSTYLNIITKYVIGRSGILGLQLHRENISVGLSYDFPVVVKNVANTGTVEVGVELRKLVIAKNQMRKRKARKNFTPNQRKPVEKKVVAAKTSEPENSRALDSKADSTTVKSTIKEDMSARLKQKQDSVIASGQVGNIQHEPLVLEKATLDFNFEFNSSEVNQKTALYLDDLAKALNDNPELQIKLVGHTDNIGSEKFNLKLSQYRAQTMKDYLISKGVNASRISAEGKGMKEPLNDNSTEEKRALNRRVELTILTSRKF
jgi:type IX secretion system PorP/SprF family membrane protein